jgi:hypothetical protein
MLRVEPGSEQTLDDVHRLLLAGCKNPSITSAMWRRLLAYPWRDRDDSFGFVLKDGSKVVGFLGTVFTPRDATGRRVCNMTSWIVEKAYPTAGAYLLREFLALENCTLTNLSATAAIARALRGLGFVDLDTSAILLTPARALTPSLLARTRILIDGGQLLGILDERGQRVFRDHSTYPCRQVVLETRTGPCHVIFNLRRSGRFKTAWVHFLDDPATFREAAAVFSLWLLFTHGATRLVVEKRLLRGLSIRNGAEIPGPQPRLYRPAGASPEELPNSYSELVMLNL